MADSLSLRPMDRVADRKVKLSSYLEIGSSGVFFIVVILVSLVALLYLLQVGSVASTGFQIHDLESEKSDLLRANQRLRYEQARLQSLTGIEHAATTRLGMQRGDHPQYVALNGSTIAENTPSPLPQTAVEASNVGQVSGPDRIPD
jgi:hypothetical protein